MESSQETRLLKKFLNQFTKKDLGVLLFFGVLIFVLGSVNIFRQPLWGDELESYRYSRLGSFFGNFFAEYYKNPDFHPPLYYALLRYFSPVTKLGLRILSLFSMILGTIPLLLIAKKWIKDELLVYLPLALYSLSGVTFYYGSEARSYALYLMLFLWALFFQDQYFNNDDRKEKKDCIVYILSSLLFLYTSYAAFLFLIFSSVTRVIMAKGSRIALKKVMVSGVFIFIGYLPWFFIFFNQMGQWSIYRPYNQDPNLLIYFIKMMQFSFLYTPFWQLPYKMISYSRLEEVLALLFLLTTMMTLYFRAGLKNVKASFFFPLLMITMVIGFVFFKDLLEPKKFFYERNLLILVPLFYLSFAQILEVMKNRVAQAFLAGAVILLGIFQPYLNQPILTTDYKTDYQVLISHLESEVKRQTITRPFPIFYSCGHAEHFEFYAKDNTLAFYDGQRIENVKRILEVSGVKEFGLINQGCPVNDELYRYLSLRGEIFYEFQWHAMQGMFLFHSN